jgi:hypothetical protein
MERIVGACIFCRHEFRRLGSLAPLARRARSSKAQRGPFDASKLVLDLDAADSKYVRRYEDEVAKEEVLDKPRDMKLARHRRGDAIAKPDTRPRQTLQEFNRPTDPDFLLYALLGNPFVQPKAHDASLQRLLKANIPDAANGDFTHNLQRLKANAERPDLPSPSEAVPVEERHAWYSDLLCRCRSMSDLARATNVICQTREGCEYLAENSNLVVEAIKQRRRKQTQTAPVTEEMVLVYLNALVQRLQLSGNAAGPGLHAAKRYYTAKRGRDRAT